MYGEAYTFKIIHRNQETELDNCSITNTPKWNYLMAIIPKKMSMQMWV